MGCGGFPVLWIHLRDRLEHAAHESRLAVGSGLSLDLLQVEPHGMEADVELSSDLVDGVTAPEKGSYPGFRRRQAEGVDQELWCEGACLAVARDVGDGAIVAESAEPKRRSARERLTT